MSELDREREIQDTMRGPPSGYFVVVPQRQEDDEVSLRKLIAILMMSWRILLGAAFLGAAIAAVVSLLMRSTYRAQVLVAPLAQSTGGLGSALRGQFGGLAALAGIDLGSSGGRKEEAIATLAAAGFARDFIAAENLMPVLFADQWDTKENRWKSNEDAPTVEAAVTKFTRSIRSISEDRKTGLVTVRIDWYSPDLAARWANRFVEMANERLRTDATRNAERSIEYLNKELARTEVVELRQAIFRLIEEQVNNAMVANVQREYAFRVIDPAAPPEIRVRPKRTVMVIFGAVIGFLAGLMLIYVRRELLVSGRSAVAPDR